MMGKYNITVDGDPIKFTTFSDGSETCKLPDTVNNKVVYVQVEIKDCNRDLIRLGLVKDALNRKHMENERNVDVNLLLPYFPQARADRVFEKGMPLPIKVFTNIINSYGFDKVYITDPHSDVTPALLDNVEVITQTNVLQNHIKRIKRDLSSAFTLCAPDLGATKKIFESVQLLGHHNYIQAVKIRDVSTGDIVKCEVLGEEISGNVLIVDDICDGGASFMFLADKLKDKGADKVGLLISHAIFSKGLDKLKGKVDYIYSDNIVGDYVTQDDLHNFNKNI